MVKDYGPLRAKAKILFEQGFSLREIGDKLKGKVHFKTVLNWSKKEGWVKGRLIPVLEQKERESVLKIAESVGLTKESTLKKIVEFQNAQKVVKAKENPDDINSENPDDSEYSFEAPDYRTQLEGNKQAIDVLGLKKEVEDNENFSRSIIAELRRKRQK